MSGAAKGQDGRNASLDQFCYCQRHTKRVPYRKVTTGPKAPRRMFAIAEVTMLRNNEVREPASLLAPQMIRHVHSGGGVPRHTGPEVLGE